MIIEDISYRKTVKISNQESEEFYALAYVEEGDDPQQSFDDLKAFVESLGGKDKDKNKDKDKDKD